MDARLFVRIEVPTLRGDGVDGEGRHGVAGTGYPVAADLILTARHVVTPARRDPRYPIRVLWPSFPGFGSKGRVDLAADDAEAIAWQGRDKDQDVALLRCPQRPPEVSVPAWPWAKPAEGASFRSQGYPSATRFENPVTGRSTPTQNAFRGTLRLSAEPWFEIVDTAAPKDAGAWAGASGMPIFTDQGIAGVFSAALTDVPGKAHAVPILPLIAADPELAALFPDDRFDRHWQACRERNRRAVAGVLLKAPRLVKELIVRLTDSDRCVALGPGSITDEERARLAADCLLGLGFEDFAQVAADLDGQLREPADKATRASGDERDALDALLAITLRLAPLLYDQTLARSTYLAAQGAGLIELPAALYSVAELMVAAEEGRAAAYQHRKGPADDDPRGLASLSAEVPELGLDATQEDYCARFAVHLGRKDLARESFDSSAFLRDCDRYLARFYPPGRPLRGATEEERLVDRRRGVDGKLPRWPDRQGRPLRLYTVFRPEDPDELKVMRATAEEIHRRYPSLGILFLTAFCGDAAADNPWDTEMRRLHDFCRILPFRPSGPGG